MATDTTTTAARPDFKVADLGLADFGRKEIQLAEHEMPGLMAMREDEGLRRAVEGWLEAPALRPEGVAAGDWLRFEQEKHQRLLGLVADAA